VGILLVSGFFLRGWKFHSFTVEVAGVVDWASETGLGSWQEDCWTAAARFFMAWRSWAGVLPAFVSIVRREQEIIGKTREREDWSLECELWRFPTQAAKSAAWMGHSVL